MKQDYRNQRVVVIGAGKSGLALVHYFLARGARVALSDRRSAEQVSGLESLKGLSLRLDLGGHDLELFEQADLVAVSPGVPLASEPLRRARSCNIPLLGEIELAARELDLPLVGVTGTNGKSTTTSLIGKTMESWGKRVFVGGNLGDPLINACSSAYDAAVVELSSFQLETTEQFHPTIALLLNLSPDHLDRYADLESYYQAKLRLFNNMTDSDYAVLNADDQEIERLSRDIRATKVWFSAQGRGVDGLLRKQNELLWNWGGSTLRLPLAPLRLKGEHNIENAMAALIPALLLGCPATTAWEAICSFAGLKHRMQLIRTLNGVSWYNDSKGTNVASVIKSLAGLEPPVTLIAGGKDKGGAFSPLRLSLAGKVEHLILIGEAAARMAAELSGATEIRLTTDLESAVRQAALVTPRGGTVLLSPACSSFDMFSSFEERGDHFEQLVRTLPGDKDG